MPIPAIACYGAIVGATVLAWFWGELPEQIGGALNLGIAGVDALTRQFAPPETLQAGLLAIDGALALCFLALVLRYGRPWLGGALLFQAAQFGLHDVYLVTGRPFDLFHAVANNVDTYGVAACIGFGALAARRAQVDAA